MDRYSETRAVFNGIYGILTTMKSDSLPALSTEGSDDASYCLNFHQCILVFYICTRFKIFIQVVHASHVNCGRKFSQQ